MMRECVIILSNRKSGDFMSAAGMPISIAFLGTGLMGAPMAKRLLKAGHQVTVWNRTSAKAQQLENDGARVAPAPIDAVRHADIVITMLEAGPVVADVMKAALPGIRTGTLVVDMSSTRQSEARQLSENLRAKGVAFIDAPVSGGVIGAENGTLAIMVGGSEHDYARMRPVFEILGHPTLVGPAGCGQLAKLCNQLIVGGTLAIVAEALLLAEAGGADSAAVRTAIRGGFADSRVLEVHGKRMLERDFMPGGKMASQTKDLENTLHAAREMNVHLPVTELVTQCYRSIVDKVPNADQSAVLLALEQNNKGKRVGTREDRLP
jgi:2-hydroxy-3-oxopropionate reductase